MANKFEKDASLLTQVKTRLIAGLRTEVKRGWRKFKICSIQTNKADNGLISLVNKVNAFKRSGVDQSPKDKFIHGPKHMNEILNEYWALVFPEDTTSGVPEN